jgi:hypothetical protein
MNAGTSAPAKPEETNGDAKCAYEGRGKSQLRLELAIIIELRLHVFVEISEKWRNHKEHPNENAKEGNTLESEIEAVDPTEDDWKTLEPDVEKTYDQKISERRRTNRRRNKLHGRVLTIYKGDVQIEQEHHGLREVKGDGPDQSHGDDIFGSHLFSD